MDFFLFLVALVLVAVGVFWLMGWKKPAVPVDPAPFGVKTPTPKDPTPPVA